MTLSFTKMHGLGNDFVVIDGLRQSVVLTPETIAALAERNTGIGFDQLLLVEAATKPGIDFQYRIFNANGQEVGQCGNGARCLALFIKRYGLSDKNHLRVATETTEMDLFINPDDSVRVDMGKPSLIPADIPLRAEKQAKDYKLSLDNRDSVRVHAITVGNPHALLIVPDVALAPVQELGQKISLHPDFPEQANVGFMQIISPSQVKLRVYERGCGETLACGSGAVAAAALGRLYYQLDATVRVGLPGGEVIVSWPDCEGPISLTGPATFVFEGKIP